jgi:hypothetical protein
LITKLFCERRQEKVKKQNSVDQIKSTNVAWQNFVDISSDGMGYGILIRQRLAHIKKARENNRRIMISHVEYPISASALVLQ